MYEAPHRVERTVTDLADSMWRSTAAVAVARELTKIYESVWRGSLDDAADTPARHAPRGEYVIVLQGAAAACEVSDDEIRSALHVALAGHSRKDAVEAVVGQLEVPKRRVYDFALAEGRHA